MTDTPWTRWSGDGQLLATDGTLLEAGRVDLSRTRDIYGLTRWSGVMYLDHLTTVGPGEAEIVLMGLGERARGRVICNVRIRVVKGRTFSILELIGNGEPPVL